MPLRIAASGSHRLDHIGRGLSAVAACSLPDYVPSVVPPPFTPPPSRVQVDTLNDQVGKQMGDRVQGNIGPGNGHAREVVVPLPFTSLSSCVQVDTLNDQVGTSPCTPKTRRCQPAMKTPDVVVTAVRPLVAECIDYEAEKSNSTISPLLPCSRGNLKCDGQTPTSILKRRRQAVTWENDVKQIPFVQRLAIVDKPDIWWSPAHMDHNRAMQADPLVQSQVHEAKVASLAQLSQFVPEVHPPQPVCPQTPGWIPVSKRPVSKGRVLESVDSHPVARLPSGPVQLPDGTDPVSKRRVLESVDSHPVARLPSGPVQPPDATDGHVARSWRDHTPVPPAAVVPPPKNDDVSNGDSWWWSDDWKQPQYKHH